MSGIDISDIVAFRWAGVKILAFTKKKSQLCPAEVETRRGVARVRIHTETLTGLLRQRYTILSGTVPTDFVKTDEKQTVTKLGKTVPWLCSHPVSLGCAI